MRASPSPKGCYLEGGLVVTEDGGPEKRTVLRRRFPWVVGTKIAFFEIVDNPSAGITVGQVLYDRVTERTDEGTGSCPGTRLSSLQLM